MKGPRRPKPRQAVAGAELRPEEVAWYGGGAREVGLTAGTGHWYKTGRARAPYQVAPRVIFGTMASVLLALEMSKARRAIDTSLLEREITTDRHRNARQARKTYRFSKDWRRNEAVDYLSFYASNFCWPVRTLRACDDRGDWRPRSPAMAVGLSNQAWS